MKKRKLNSKNPKYMDKSLVTQQKVIRKELIKDIKGVKVHAVWYDHSKRQGGNVVNWPDQ